MDNIQQTAYLDNHPDVTIQAYKQKPMQFYLRCAWLAFLVSICYRWTNLYFFTEIGKKCYVKETMGPLGPSYSLVSTLEESTAEDINVGANFEFIAFIMFGQAIAMLLCCAYQIVAIKFSKAMLKYRFHISRLNKCVLLFGVYCMVYLHTYRLSQPGRLCSGDYLTAEQFADNSIVDKYLYQRGEFFQSYI